MPYYKGDAPDVCSVFGNSFQFYNYILQSRERIRQLEGDYFLIIGDDLLLNPRFDEFSTPSLLGIHGEDTCYLDGFVDVSLPVCYRGTAEAHHFSITPPGIDAESVNRNVPSYEEAEILVKVGDKVEAEQSLITVEGDKASMEVPAPFAGTVKEIKVRLFPEGRNGGGGHGHFLQSRVAADNS